MTFVVTREYAKNSIEFFYLFDKLFDNTSDNAPESEQKFADFIRETLENNQMKSQLNEAIHEKANQLLALASPKGDYFFLRSFLRFLISLDNEEVLNSLETHYATDKTQKGYIIFIDEMQKQERDVSGSVKTFLSLLKINGIYFEIVDRLLAVIKKDRVFVVKELIQNKLFDELVYYLNNLFQLETELKYAKDFSKTVRELKNQFESSEHYLTIVYHLVSFDSDVCSTFFENEKENTDFQAFILSKHKSFGRAPALFKNYSLSLSDDKFLQFEKSFLSCVDSAHILVEFAKMVERSSKREILKKLVAAGNESYLIHFIKQFPQYKHLLLML